VHVFYESVLPTYLTNFVEKTPYFICCLISQCASLSTDFVTALGIVFGILHWSNVFNDAHEIFIAAGELL